MSSGIKSSCNRPKLAKHLRTATTKTFRNDDPEAKARYLLKIQRRIDRRRKKSR